MKIFRKSTIIILKDISIKPKVFGSKGVKKITYADLEDFIDVNKKPTRRRLCII